MLQAAWQPGSKPQIVQIQLEAQQMASRTGQTNKIYSLSPGHVQWKLSTLDHQIIIIFLLSAVYNVEEYCHNYHITKTPGLVRSRCWDPWPWCCSRSGRSSCLGWRICHRCQWSQGVLKLLIHLSFLFHFSRFPTMVDPMWLQYPISLPLCHR